MKESAVTWAQQHDWFICADQQGEHSDDWTVTVEERGTQLQDDGKGAEYAERLNFNSVRELRDWAGY